MLPNFFEGLTFSIAEDINEEERALLARYVRAYGGLVLEVLLYATIRIGSQ